MPRLSNEEFLALFTKLALTLPNKLGAAKPLIDLGEARYGDVFGNLFILMGFLQDLGAGQVKTWAEFLQREAKVAEDMRDKVQAHIFRCMIKGWKYAGQPEHNEEDWPDLWLDLDGKHQGTSQPMGEIQP